MSALATFSSRLAIVRVRVLDTLRQWRFPAEFRIVGGTRSDELDKLVVCLAIEFRKSQAVPSTASILPVADGGVARSLLDQKKFIVELCNQYFRLHRHIATLSNGKRATGDLKPLQRALERVQKILEGEDVVCADLAGQDYDEGRTDFERFGEFERRPGLSRRLIVECERPLVTSGGRIWQKARGTVAVPE